MPTLNEIDRASVPIEYQDDYVAMPEEYKELLIRAVRQLGEERRALHGGLIEELVPQPDSDVLALLEEL